MPRREGERSNGSKINQCFDLGNSGYFASKMSIFHENKARRITFANMLINVNSSPLTCNFCRMVSFVRQPCNYVNISSKTYLLIALPLGASIGQFINISTLQAAHHRSLKEGNVCVKGVQNVKNVEILNSYETTLC